MRTNIVLDDALMAQALALTGASSKKEVVSLALHNLVDSYREKKLINRTLLHLNIDNPIINDGFIPLEREEIYAR